MEQVMEDAKELRRDVDEGSMIFAKRYPHGEFWLTLTTDKDERPVNLVIPRKTLETLSAKRFNVTPEKPRARAGSARAHDGKKIF